MRQEQGVLPIDVLIGHFSAVFNRTADPVPMVFCEEDFAVSDAELDVLFTVEELEMAVRELDRGTAPGVTVMRPGVARCNAVLMRNLFPVYRVHV